MIEAILLQLDTSIDYDRESGQFNVTVDGASIGFANTQHDGQVLIEEHARELLDRGLISDDPRDYAIEPPNYKLSPAQREWLARQFGVQVLPSAEVVITALEALASESTRSVEQRAYRKAATFVTQGTYPTRDGDGWQVVGSTGKIYHIANGRCDCTAGTNSRECWHESLVYGLNTAMRGGAR